MTSYEKFIFDILLEVCQVLVDEWGLKMFIDSHAARVYGRGIDDAPVAGAFMPPNNPYSPGQPVIVMFSEGMAKMVEMLATQFPKCDPTNKTHIVRIVTTTLKHEYRHYQQWKWLCDHGREEMWAPLTKTSDYYGDPLEYDANAYMRNREADLDSVMEYALDRLAG